MSTSQILVLGALAGFTIFLGLPVGRSGAHTAIAAATFGSAVLS